MAEPGTLVAPAPASQLPSIDPATCRARRAVVIYHSPCADGLGSLWAAWHLLGQQGFAVHAIPMGYGSKDRPRPIPIEEIRTIQPERIYIVDFSFSPAEMQKFCRDYSSEVEIILLDHHKSAIEEWRGAPGMHSVIQVEDHEPYATKLYFRLDGKAVHFVYPMDNKGLAGSGLTWRYIDNHSGKNAVPPALYLINDRDLWKLSDEAIHLNAYIQAYLSEPEQWNDFAQVMSQAGQLEVAIEGGKQLTRARQAIVKSAVGSSIKFGYLRDKDGPGGKEVIWRYALVDVPAALASETAEYVRQRCQLNGERIDFVVMWYTDRDGLVRLSLRSEDASHADVSKIAGRFGGGGHRNASGASNLSLGQFTDHFLRHIERESIKEHRTPQHILVPSWRAFTEWLGPYCALPEVQGQGYTFEMLSDVADERCVEAQKTYLSSMSAPVVLGQGGGDSNN